MGAMLSRTCAEPGHPRRPSNDMLRIGIERSRRDYRITGRQAG